MLVSFTDLQTGQASRKTSQDLHEHRCLQGRKIKHDLRELQRLQAIFLLSSFTSPCSLTAVLDPQKRDSASSAPLLTQTKFSLMTCSSVLLRSMAIASFSSASLCHEFFSISALLRSASSSIVFFVARAKSSSFRLIKFNALDSILLSRIASCRFFRSRKADLSLSFCFLF